jgi:hypothetical protein
MIYNLYRKIAFLISKTKSLLCGGNFHDPHSITIIHSQKNNFIVSSRGSTLIINSLLH